MFALLDGSGTRDLGRYPGEISVEGVCWKDFNSISRAYSRMPRLMIGGNVTALGEASPNLPLERFSPSARSTGTLTQWISSLR